MNYPDKPDYTATKIATQGLTLEWIQVRGQQVPPPLITWKEGTTVIPGRIPNHLKSKEKADSAVNPIPRDMGGTRHCDLRYPQIPDVVHVSRLFIVPEDLKLVRPS